MVAPFRLLAVLALAGLCTAQSGSTRKRTVALYLPLEFGTRWNVSQGQNMGPSHTDKWNRYALDFDLPVGTAVHAAADGIVVAVKEDTTGPTGKRDDNNTIILRHADGTATTYDHLKKDGALVALGDRVLAGDHIGWSGNTGSSTGPHLHFNLFSSYPGGVSIPFKFADVPKKGIPRKGEAPVSLNYPVRKVVGGLAWLRETYTLCQKLDRRDALTKILKPRLGKKSLPTDLRRLIAAAAKRGRKGLDEIVRRRRDALRKLCADDRSARVAALDKALAEKRHADAARLAFTGALDFEWLDPGPFRRAQSLLGRDRTLQPLLKPILKELNATRSDRRDLTKALTAAWKLRTLTGKRRASAVKKARKSFDAVLARSAAAPKAALQEWLQRHLQ